jgi:hypothetical protein
MRVGSVAHAIRQCDAAPQIGCIQGSLHGKDCIEEDQRSHQRSATKQGIQCRLARYRRGGLRLLDRGNGPCRPPPSRQTRPEIGPGAAGHDDPEKHARDIEVLQQHENIDAAQPVLDDRIGDTEQSDENRAQHQRHDPAEQTCQHVATPAQPLADAAPPNSVGSEAKRRDEKEAEELSANPGDAGSQSARQRERKDREADQRDRNRQRADIFDQRKQRERGDCSLSDQAALIETHSTRRHDQDCQQPREDKPTYADRLIEQQEIGRDDRAEQEDRSRQACSARPGPAYAGVNQRGVAHAAQLTSRNATERDGRSVKTAGLLPESGTTSHHPSMITRSGRGGRRVRKRFMPPSSRPSAPVAWRCGSEFAEPCADIVHVTAWCD